MPELIAVLVYFAGPVLLLMVALFSGNAIAARHERQMTRRQELAGPMTFSDCGIPPDASASAPASLVCAEVCLGIDHFRGFLGKLKNIFGGEVRSYQLTLDRARREALLQLQEQAAILGCNTLANLRVDFVDISGNATLTKKASMVTILACATACNVPGPCPNQS